MTSQALNNENQIYKTVAVKLLDEIQPTVQNIVAYRARLLSGLAADLLTSAGNSSVCAGLRLIRDELRSLSSDIRKLAPEEGSLEWLLAESDQWELRSR